MAPKTSKSGNKLGWNLLGIGIAVALAIAFTVDDLTGVGELLDPVEYMAMAAYGTLAPKFFGGMQ